MSENEDKSDLMMTIAFVAIIVIALVVFIVCGKIAKQQQKEMENGVTIEIEQAAPLYEAPKLPQDINQYNKYRFQYDYNFEFSKNGKELTLRLPVPQTEEGSQYITDLKYSVTPNNVYTDGLNKFAEISFHDITPGTKTIQVTGNIYTRTYNIERAKELHLPFKKETNLKQYLKEENGIESDSSYIKGIALKIRGNSQEEIVDNIFKYLNKNLTYTIITGEPSAIATLRSKKGKCVHYSVAMVALCRAKGIPARLVTGDILRDRNTEHTWVEVYYDDYGWVNYDPTILTSYIHHYVDGRYLKSERTIMDTNLDYIKNVRNNTSPWTMRLDSIGEDANIFHFTSDTKFEKIN